MEFKVGQKVICIKYTVGVCVGEVYTIVGTHNWGINKYISVHQENYGFWYPATSFIPLNIKGTLYHGN